jgi:hypothetical protein
MSTTSKHPTKQPLVNRFDASQAHDASHVIDSIGLMTERASGVLALLYAHFQGETRMNDVHILAALNAVMTEVEDINDVLICHSSAVRQGGAQ